MEPEYFGLGTLFLLLVTSNFFDNEQVEKMQNKMPEPNIFKLDVQQILTSPEANMNCS